MAGINYFFIMEQFKDHLTSSFLAGTELGICSCRSGPIVSTGGLQLIQVSLPQGAVECLLQ